MSLLSGQVTVVVPAFNDAENLYHCLSSLLRARDALPMKIIVVDDGSSDSTAEVVSKFDVVHIRSEENRGQSWARNYGAKLSESEYILFIDSDVVVYEDCFKQIGEFISMEKPHGLIGMQGIFSLEHPSKEWPSLIYNALQYLLSKEPYYNLGVNTSFFLVARRDFEGIGGFKEDLWFMEDNEFAQRMAASCKFVAHGPSRFIHRKKVSWFWLFRTHFLGGKMLYILSRIKSKRECPKIRLPDKGAGVNRVFLNWLIAGIILITMFLLLAAISHPYARAGIVGGGIAVCCPLLINSITLFKVRNNPNFFIIGMIIFLILPWLILLGRLSGPFSMVSERERRLWAGER